MAPGYLLDTNVVSEAVKPRPHPGVLSFLTAIREGNVEVYISVLTLGELRKGIAAKRVRDAAGADRLALWVDEIERDFSDRALPIGRPIARLWGELSAARSAPAVDTLIAATALVHDLTLVTRNVRDVAATGARLLNPWNEVQPTQPIPHISQ